jgi:putative SOS response-associated peptidase YedK
MCGKFTSLATWREVHDFSLPLTVPAGEAEVITFRPMTALPVIIFDREARCRRVVPMRWGFPHRADWRRPDPIHARSETIDERPTFRDAFIGGQRGIVVMRTFNEGRELENGKTEQWTINPGDGVPRGFAFLWRRFELKDVPAPLLACVMVTVPPSKLVAQITDRMPAILEDVDWSTWLGEGGASAAEAKAVLRTMEGVNWTMAPEARATKRNGRKPGTPTVDPLV